MMPQSSAPSVSSVFFFFFFVCCSRVEEEPKATAPYKVGIFDFSVLEWCNISRWLHHGQQNVREANDRLLRLKPQFRNNYASIIGGL
jgi:hypothetical protein